MNMHFFTGDSDYQGEMFLVSLPPTNDNISTFGFSVPILDDDILECQEEFFLDLEIPESHAIIALTGKPDTARVRILDDDGQFESSL